jgi:predicted DNA-binding protein with PD1-like motif
MEGLLAALSDHGLSQAGVVFLHGAFEAVTFMTGRPDNSGQRAATHAGPWTLEGPLTLLGGGAIVGLGADDRPVVHCHALFAGPDGAVRGGHMLAGKCPLDEPGLVALACCPDEAGFKIALDRETNFPIFHPLGHLSGKALR